MWCSPAPAIRPALVLVAVVASFPFVARADLASMVADLEVEAGPNLGSFPHSFETVGSRVVFFAREPLEPEFVAATDGTCSGTVRLPVDEEPVQSIGVVGGAYLWFGQAETGGYSLWRSDGTPAGTGPLVADLIWEPPYEQTGSILVGRSGDRILFFRRDGDLWASDGTAAGTARIARAGRVGPIIEMAVHREEVYFATASVTLEAGAPQYSGWRLWRMGAGAAGARSLTPLPASFGGALYSTARRVVFFAGGRLWANDGTRSGTAPVAAPPGEPGFGVTWIGGVIGGRLYFGGRHPRLGEALWSSDGTGAGTRLLARGLTFDPQWPAVALGNRLFFVAADPSHGFELWTTRGSAATTAQVVDLCPGECSAFVGPVYGRQLAAAGARVAFLADDGSRGRELWSTDGTAAGTRPARDHCPGACGIGTVLESAGGDVFYYLHGTRGVELWASDGSAAGTRRLTDLALIDTFGPPGGLLPELSLARIGAAVVSVGWDARGGEEPFLYSGDGSGGVLLSDLARTGVATASDPFDALAIGDRLVFLTGREGPATAWSTLGTPDTTVALGVLPAPRLPFEPPLTGIAGGVGYLNLGDLWRTDGTPAGTLRLTDFAAIAPGSRVSTAIADLGGRAVFGVTAGGSQTTELWTSDGTAAGTRRAPLPPLPLRIFDLTAVGGELYFWGNDGAFGWEICALDAALTAMRALTERASPQEPGPLWVEPAFTLIGGRLYFMVPDRSGGASLWRSDGTAAGTGRVPAPSVGGVEQRRLGFAGLGDAVLLFTSAAGGLGVRLWAGDGSGADWLELADFGAGSRLGEVVRRDGELLFAVRLGGGGGLRLFRSDGTAAGTAEAVDLAALGVGEVHSLAPAGDRLYFAAGPEAGRTELWLSDGATATTRRLQEIAPGPRGSTPGGFTAAGPRLYFAADDGLHGRELWSLAPGEIGAPCRPSPTALCLGEGRFRAELYRHDRAGARGDGRAVAWSSWSGAFWYYAHGNPEAVVKMVDGGAVNGRYWLFFGPLGDAFVALTVTDVESGDARRYPAEPGPLPAFADLAAFPGVGTAAAGAPESAAAPEGAAGEPLVPAAPAVACGTPGPCVPDDTRLCLHGGRFAVELTWRDPAGAEHAARGFEHGNQAAFFAFHGAGDLQAALKILDGRAVNGRWWLFATSLTHLGHTLTVTDTATGALHEYTKPAGDLASVVDLSSLR